MSEPLKKSSSATPNRTSMACGRRAVFFAQATARGSDFCAEKRQAAASLLAACKSRAGCKESLQPEANSIGLRMNGW